MTISQDDISYLEDNVFDIQVGISLTIKELATLNAVLLDTMVNMENDNTTEEVSVGGYKMYYEYKALQKKIGELGAATLGGTTTTEYLGRE